MSNGLVIEVKYYEELKRLARIGAATEKMFKDNAATILLNAEFDSWELTSCSGEINELEELLKWAESEV